MSNDSSASGAPFGEVEFPKKKKSPFAVASGKKAVAAAASVRANILEPDEDFAGTPQVQRIRTKEALGDLPDVDDFAQPAKSSPSSGEIPQLVLKAIFGVSKEMDRAEILRRASELPQVASVHVVGPAEQQALQLLQKSFSTNGPLTLRVAGGDIDLIEESGLTLAVLTKGGYAAGVRETLIIVARELAQLV